MDMRWCPECADETRFVVPPCEDGHGEDCLDLACDLCGFAVVTGLVEETVLAEVRAA